MKKLQNNRIDENKLQVNQFSQILVNAQTAYSQMIEISIRLNDLETLFKKQINEELSDEGWMKLSAAAKRCGLTIPALRQRIKRFQYPENIVWKQRDINSSIFVNVKKLREYL